MGKKVEVIIQKTHKQIGKKNDIIIVTQGYAFNYLIPNQLAQIATKGKIKHIKMIESIEKSKLANEQNKALIIKNKLEQISKISIPKKTGNKQQIFGSINDKEIIMQITHYTGVTLEKKQIDLPEIKIIGIYLIKIHILNHIYVNVKLQVLPAEIKINA